MKLVHFLGDAVSFYQQFLGEFLFSAASVSAVAFGVFASTGMIIWAAIGLVGLISGLVTVRVARHHNQPAKPAATKAALDTTAQPSALAGATPVSADDVTQAA